MTRTKSPKNLATHVLLPVLVLAATALIPGSADAGVSTAGPQAGPTGAYVPGELIVRYVGEETPETVEFSPAADPVEVAELVEERAGVAYATPNFVARISGWTPDDAGVNPPKRGRPGGWRDRQWNFLPCLSLCRGGASIETQSPGGMNVTGAWNHLRKAGRPGARGVKVAVLDTGVAYRDHGKRYRRDPDLSPKSFVPGYDFVDGDRLPLDRNGHGTHVSSTIAQATDNGLGLTGVAYRAKLMPVRVMDANGFGTTENVIKGIRWAADHGARVISMSLNFACGASIPPLQEALRHAHSKGVVLVGSSGNKGAQTCPSLPATSPQVISVGGNTESGCIANYSFKSAKIDVTAPGGGSASGCPSRTSDRPILQFGMLTIGYRQAGFGIKSGWKGTSMAAAHVAGAAAMVLASDAIDRKGPRQVRNRLLDTARLPAHAKEDPDSGFGAGIINLGKAVNPNYQ